MLIGLDKILQEINIYINRFNSEKSLFPHTLFIGPRGCGKTTLARYIHQHLKVPFIEVNGAGIDTHRLIQLLMNIKKYQILFIDEIHRLHIKSEEILYNPLSDNKLNLSLGVSNLSISLPPMTIIGATTRPNLLSKPLLSRFKLVYYLPGYSIKTLARIVRTHFQSFSLRECILIASLALTPREVLYLGERLEKLNLGVEQGLLFLGYKEGLSPLEQRYLRLLREYNTLSLSNLSNILGLDEEAVGLVEERLLRLKLIGISSKGRTLSPLGYLKVRRLDE